MAYSQKGQMLGQDITLSSGRLSWLHGAYILKLTRLAYAQPIRMNFTIIHTPLGGARKSEIPVSGHAGENRILSGARLSNTNFYDDSNVLYLCWPVQWLLATWGYQTLEMCLA